MIATQDIDRIIGAEAVGPDNDKIGKVGQVYIDQDNEQPVWVSVKSGIFGTSETLVPLTGADLGRVRAAPRVLEAVGQGRAAGRPRRRCFRRRSSSGCTSTTAWAPVARRAAWSAAASSTAP